MRTARETKNGFWYLHPIEIPNTLPVAYIPRHGAPFSSPSTTFPFQVITSSIATVSLTYWPINMFTYIALGTRPRHFSPNIKWVELRSRNQLPSTGKSGHPICFTLQPNPHGAQAYDRMGNIWCPRSAVHDASTFKTYDNFKEQNLVFGLSSTVSFCHNPPCGEYNSSSNLV